VHGVDEVDEQQRIELKRRRELRMHLIHGIQKLNENGRALSVGVLRALTAVAVALCKLITIKQTKKQTKRRRSKQTEIKRGGGRTNHIATHTQQQRLT
jgi:hypothetical protein